VRWLSTDDKLPRVTALPRYLANLSAGRLLLWCYLIWYAVVLVRNFDPDPRLWLTSAGMGVIIGVALYVSTTASTALGGRLGFWPTARLFMMPFCVSSFAALVKGKGFILVFSPRPADLYWGAGLCAVFCGLVAAFRFGYRQGATNAAITSFEDSR
jgi:hypothetical protein